MNLFEMAVVLLVPLYYGACLVSAIVFIGGGKEPPASLILALFFGQFVFPLASFLVILSDIGKRGFAKDRKSRWILLTLLLWPAQVVYFFMHGRKPRPAIPPVLK